MRRRRSPLRRYSLAADPVSKPQNVSFPGPWTLPKHPRGDRREPFTSGIRPLRPGSRRGEQPFVLAVCRYGKGIERERPNTKAEFGLSGTLLTKY